MLWFKVFLKPSYYFGSMYVAYGTGFCHNDANRNNFLCKKRYFFLSHKLPLNLLRYDPVGSINQCTFKNNLDKYFFHTKKII